MRAVLLGPNGQLGSDIRAANIKSGEMLSVIAVGRSAVDLSDIEAATTFLGGLNFDCLINCSSYHNTDQVEHNAQTAFVINAHLVQRLAEICRQKKARLVHFSTDYVFGGQRKRTPLAETDCKCPVNVYGASKAMGEDLALMTGADILILRVASLFGIAGASGKGGNFVETMIRLGREKGTLRVVSDQTMSPSATADIAQAVLSMIGRRVPSGIWNVVNSGAATWYDFAARIISQARIAATVIPIPTSEYTAVAKRPPYSVLDNSKLVSSIGPMRPWQDALEAYLLAKGYLPR